VLIGGGLGNAVLFSIEGIARQRQPRDLLRRFKRAIDRYKVDEIERAADVIICAATRRRACPPTAAGQGLRRQHVAALDAYGPARSARASIPLGAGRPRDPIGSDGHDGAVARPPGILARHLKPAQAIASINSPINA